jgi:exopolyphosphatase / guanosine-5'-triphosphate,3'-diphosphate pyrophosphatase
MRLAAVDIGSNTVHALVADAEDHRLEDVAHEVLMPGLGPVVARTGQIGQAKQEEVLRDLEAVVQAAAREGYERLVAGATAAVRQARDGGQLLARAEARIGVPVRLISEEREAQLSFAGVAAFHAAKREWLMCDLGGGSTELVVGRGRDMGRWVSLELGSGTLADRLLSDPPTAAQREALRRAALDALAGAPEAAAEKLVATGGTASNLPQVLSRQAPPQHLTVDALLTAAERLDARPAAEVAARSGLPEARVRALRAGVEILLLLLDFYGLHSLHVSHQGLRHGMLLAYLERGDDWWLVN